MLKHNIDIDISVDLDLTLISPDLTQDTTPIPRGTNTIISLDIEYI